MARRDLALVFLLAVVVTGAAALLIRQPAYMDAYYYFDGALQLVRGRGFSEPYLWNYLAGGRSLPAPSHLYWMPLTSMAAAPFIWAAEQAGGQALPNSVLFRAGQAPMILAAAALPALTYAVARWLTGVRRHALAAAALTLFSAYYFPFWTTTDAFALHALAATGAFLAYDWARRAHPRASAGFFLSGLLAGLAHLARADGLLVLACLGLFHLAGVLAGSRRSLNLDQAWRPLAGLLAGYLLVMGPWFLRNWLAVGAPLAPNSGRTLWLTNYDELFTYAPEKLTLARYVVQGWPQILSDKGRALTVNFQRLVAEQTNIIAFPFVLVGGWRLRAQPLVQLALLYGAALFAAMTLAFTFPGQLGGYFHSGAAMLPFVYAVALAGLDAAVEAVARRLKHWQPEKSKPVFTILLVAGAALLTAIRFPSALPAAQHADAVYAEIGVWLDAHAAPEDRAAVNNPPAFYYHTGRSAIVVPGDDVAALVQAMTDLGVRWLVLDVNVTAGVMPLYSAPDHDPRFRLRATFEDGSGRAVYVLERVPPS